MMFCQKVVFKVCLSMGDHDLQGSSYPPFPSQNEKKDVYWRCSLVKIALTLNQNQNFYV